MQHASRFFTLSLAALIAASLPVSAAPYQHEARHAAGASTKSAPASNVPVNSRDQVDGMCSAVVDQLWDRTDYYWHHGDYPRIIQLDRIITESDPHFLEPYSTGGWLMESDGDLKDAEAYYKLGATRNPDKSYAWYQLGMFYFNTERAYDKSLAVFQRSTKLKDAGDLDWKMLAHSYERTHNLPAALTAWQTVKKLFPNAPAVDANMQRVKAELAAQNLMPAVNHS